MLANVLQGSETLAMTAFMVWLSESNQRILIEIYILWFYISLKDELTSKDSVSSSLEKYRENYV